MTTAPTFERNGGWWFWGIEEEILGPYSTKEMAVQKYHEYVAFVVTMPGCHHS